MQMYFVQQSLFIFTKAANNSDQHCSMVVIMIFDFLVAFNFIGLFVHHIYPNVEASGEIIVNVCPQWFLSGAHLDVGFQ